MGLVRWYNPKGSRVGMWAQYLSHSGQIRGAIYGVVESWAYGANLEDNDSFKWLTGKRAGLFELEVKVNHSQQFRILGFKGPQSGDYTLLTGFQKDKGVESYGRTGEQAFRRIRKIKRDGGTAPPLPIP